MKKHAIFDTELIGKNKPVFLTCVEIVETNERFAFWHDKRGHTAKLEKMLQRDDLTWVGFNSENFDRPLIAAAVMGHDEENLKIMATHIVEDQMRSWQTYREFDIDFLEYDHIDLIETAPGVMISLKTYAGRMHYPTMQDMPFHHDDEIATPKQRKIVEGYCFNDIGVTKQLFLRLKTELELRAAMSAEYGVDLRSKSDAQIAEAVLKARVGITSNKDKYVPLAVDYTAPSFIKTRSKVILELIERLENHRFAINRGNGSPEMPEFLTEPLVMGTGVYKCGLGGLHSQHDVKFYAEATPTRCLSDFDVASYYPNIMMKAGLIPNLGGNKGVLFLEEYQKLYELRIEAKRTGNKKVANPLKIVLNATFGKLGNLFCSFYAPELMLAVTITGQLNLLCLIHELERIPGVTVYSANTDGVGVSYPPEAREKVLEVFSKNSRRTGFEYEETRYAKVAMKDVNNYIAVTADEVPVIVASDGTIMGAKSDPNKLKRKGLYAELTLMKNPTMEVCSNAAAEFLRSGTLVEDYINGATRPELFMAIRNVKGGGVQHKKSEMVDDWVLVLDSGNSKNLWMRQAWLDAGRSIDDQGGGGAIQRKSRPHPVEIFSGGVPFGRVARWYMTKEALPPISYVGSGNKVPKTEGAKLCMTLPESLPDDLDYQWYIEEAISMLNDMGVVY